MIYQAVISAYTGEEVTLCKGSLISPMVGGGVSVNGGECKVSRVYKMLLGI